MRKQKMCTEAELISRLTMFKKPVPAVVSMGIISAARQSSDPRAERLARLAGKEVKIRGAVKDGAWLIGVVKSTVGVTGYDPINLLYVDDIARKTIEGLLEV